VIKIYKKKCSYCGKCKKTGAADLVLENHQRRSYGTWTFLQKKYWILVELKLKPGFYTCWEVPYWNGYDSCSIYRQPTAHLIPGSSCSAQHRSWSSTSLGFLRLKLGFGFRRNGSQLISLQSVKVGGNLSQQALSEEPLVATPWTPSSISFGSSHQARKWQSNTNFVYGIGLNQ